MSEKEPADERFSGRRRRFLRGLGATGLAGVTVGCVGGGDDSDDADGVDNGDDGDDPDNGDDPNGEEETEPATFEIADLDPADVTATAAYDEDGEPIAFRPDPVDVEVPIDGSVDLTATVENVGEGAGSQQVTLAIDGEERESVSLDLESGAEGEVEFTDIDVRDFDPGATYEIRVETEDDAATAAVAVEERHRPATVGLDTVATGFDDRPVAVATAPGSDRLYVVDRTVGVFVCEDGQVREEPFLDLSDDLRMDVREEGVLGFEFHPNFEENRLCYAAYTAPVREGTPGHYNNTSVVAEFEASEDGLTADRDAERTVIEVPQPDIWHNVGNLDFGPDGYLYLTMGDGGGGGDQGHDHATDWYDDVGGGDAQSPEKNLLGGVLRLDVDAEPTEHHRTDPDAPDEPEGEEGYAIPEDNPLVGEEGRDEFYAWGLRSPWGTYFDGEDYYVADVGQTGWEEVNLVEKGGNYGWNVKEGSHCFQSGDCPDSTPEDVRGGEPLLDPIVEYPRDVGVCVIGGAVYRGEAIPGLGGQYVFADLFFEGRLFVATPPGDGGEGWDFSELPVRDEDAANVGQILSFAVDPDGELLVTANSGDDGNSVHRIVPAE